MGDNTSSIPPGVTGWPPPKPTAMRTLSFAFGGAAAIAGCLGYCLPAAILALLSLIFNLWDFFQGGSGKPKQRSSGSDTSYSGSGAAGSGSDRPDRY
jgi:hypothetical protein